MAKKPEIDLVKLFNGGETLSDLNSLIDGMNKREIAKALRGTFAKFKGHHQWWEHGKNLDGAWSIYDPIEDRQVVSRNEDRLSEIQMKQLAKNFLDVYAQGYFYNTNGEYDTGLVDQYVQGEINARKAIPPKSKAIKTTISGIDKAIDKRTNIEKNAIANLKSQGKHAKAAMIESGIAYIPQGYNLKSAMEPPKDKDIPGETYTTADAKRRRIQDIMKSKTSETLKGIQATDDKGAYTVGSTSNFNFDVRNKNGVVDPKKLADFSKNIRVIDFETIGERGTGNFAPVEVAITDLDKTEDKSLHKYLQIEKNSEAFTTMNNLIKQIGEGKFTGKLSPEQRRSILWLADFTEETDKQGNSKIVSKHHTWSDNFEIKKDTDIFKKIEEGWRVLTTTDKTYTNRATRSELTETMKKMGLIDDKGNSKVTWAAHNASFDTGVLTEDFGVKVGDKYLDSLAIARKIFPTLEMSKGYGMEALINSEQNELKTIFANSKASQKYLEHTAKYDTAVEADFIKEMLTKHPEIFNEDPNLEKTIKPGMVGFAGKGMIRKQKEDFVYSEEQQKPNKTENKYKQAEEEKWEKNLLFQKNQAYEFQGFKQMDKEVYSAVFKNVETGKVSVVEGSLRHVLDTVGNVFNFNFGDMKTKGKLSKLGEQVQSQAIQNMLTNNYSLSAQLKLLSAKQKEKAGQIEEAKKIRQEVGVEEQERFKLTEGFLKNNGLHLKYINKQLEKSGLSSAGKNFVLKTLAQTIGNEKNSVIATTDIEKEITNGVSWNSDSYKQAYLSYIEQHKSELGNNYSQIKKNIIDSDFTEKDFVKNDDGSKKNPYYFITRQITESMIQKGTRKPTYITKDFYTQGNLSLINKLIETTQNSFSFGGTPQGFVDKLKRDFKNTPLADLMSGKHLEKRVNNAQKAPNKTKVGSSGKGGLGILNAQNLKGVGTFEKGLINLIEAAEKQGLGVHLNPNSDGSNLGISLYKLTDADAFAATLDKNGNTIYKANEGRMAKFNIPIPNSEGVYTRNGMSTINMMHLDYERGINGGGFITSLPEMIIDKITNVITDKNGTNKTVKYLIDDNFKAATGALQFFVDDILNNSQTAGTYSSSVAKEVRSNSKAGGTYDQNAARKQMLDFSKFLTEMYAEAVGKQAKDLTGQIDDQLSVMFDYMYLETQMTGLGDKMFFGGDLKKLSNTDNFGDFREKMGEKNFAYGANLEKLFTSLKSTAAQLPRLHIEDVKEEAVDNLRASLTGYKDRIAFGDLNATYMRASAQGFNYVPRGKKAFDAIKEFNNYYNNSNNPNNYVKTGDYFRSGHINKEEYRKGAKDGSKHFFNVGHVDDFALQEAWQELKKNGSTEIKELMKGMSVPSVYEGMSIISESMAKRMEGTIRRDVKLNEFDNNFGLSLDLLNLLGEGPNTLQQALATVGDGDYISLFGDKGYTLKEDMVVAHELSDEDMERHSVKMSAGSILKGIRKKGDTWVLDTIQKIKAETNSKGLVGQGRTTHNVINDKVYAALAKQLGVENAEVLMESRSTSDRYFTETVGDRYNYILSTALENGITFDEIDNLFKTGGAMEGSVLGKYLGTSVENKDIHDKVKRYWLPFAERARDGINAGKFVDRDGNILFSTEEELAYFAMSPEESVSTGHMGVMSMLINELDKIYQGKSNGQSIKDLLSKNITRTTVGLANDPHYGRINNYEDQGMVDSNGNVRLGNREFDSLKNKTLFLSSLTSDPDKIKGLQKFYERVKSVPKTQKILDLEKQREQLKQAFTDTAEGTKRLIQKDLSNVLTVNLFGETEFDDPKMVSLSKFLNNYVYESGSITQEQWESGTYQRLLKYISEYNEGKAIEEQINQIRLYADPKNIGAAEGEATGFNFKMKSRLNKDISVASDSIYIPIIEEATYVNGKIMPNKAESAFNKLVNYFATGDIQKGLTVGGEEYLSTIYDTVADKDGAMFKDLNTVKVNVSAPSTLMGKNIVDFEGQIEALENSVFYSPEKFKELIKPNNESMRTNLGLMYNYLFENDKNFNKINVDDLIAKDAQGNYITDENTINQYINEITEALDIVEKDGQGKATGRLKDATTLKAIKAFFHRFPSFSGKDLMSVNLRVDSTIKEIDNLGSYISPGLAAAIKGDYDGDKGYLYLPTYADPNLDEATFREMVGHMDAIAEIDEDVTKLLSKQVIAKAKKSKIEDSQKKDFEKSDALKTANKLFNPELEETTNLLAKHNKKYVGYFSNVNYSYRQALMGLMSKIEPEKGSLAEKFKGRVTSDLLTGFFKIMEEDTISAKKVSDRLYKALQSGEKLDFLLQKFGMGELFSEVYKREAGAFGDKGTSDSKTIYQKMGELGLIDVMEDGEYLINHRQPMNANIASVVSELAKIGREFNGDEKAIKEFEDEFFKTTNFDDTGNSTSLSMGFLRPIYDKLKENGFNIDNLGTDFDYEELIDVTSGNINQMFKYGEHLAKIQHGSSIRDIVMAYVRANTLHGMASTKGGRKNVLDQIFNSQNLDERDIENYALDSKQAALLASVEFEKASDKVILDTENGAHDYYETDANGNKLTKLDDVISASKFGRKFLLMDQYEDNSLRKEMLQTFENFDTMFYDALRTFEENGGNLGQLGLQNTNDFETQIGKFVTSEYFKNSKEIGNKINALASKESKDSAWSNHRNFAYAAGARGTLEHLVVEKIEKKAKELRSLNDEKKLSWAGDRIFNSQEEVDEYLSTEEGINNFQKVLRDYVGGKNINGTDNAELSELMKDSEFQKVYLEYSLRNKLIGSNTVRLETLRQVGQTYLSYEQAKHAKNSLGNNIVYNVGQKIAEKAWMFKRGGKTYTGSIDLVSPTFKTTRDSNGNLIEELVGLSIDDHKFKAKMLDSSNNFNTDKLGILETLQLSLGRLAYQKLIRENPDEIIEGMKKSYNDMTDAEKAIIDSGIGGNINQFVNSKEITQWQANLLSPANIMKAMDFIADSEKATPEELKNLRAQVTEFITKGTYSGLSTGRSYSYDENGIMDFNGVQRLYGLQTLQVNEDGSKEIVNLDYSNADITDIYNSWLLRDQMVSKGKKGYKITGDFKKEKIAFFGADGKLVGNVWEGEQDNIPLSTIYESMGIDENASKDVLKAYQWMVHTHPTKNGEDFGFSQADINTLLNSPLLGYLKYFSIMDKDGNFKHINLTKIDKMNEFEGIKNFENMTNIEKRKAALELGLNEMIEEEQKDERGDGKTLRGKVMNKLTDDELPENEKDIFPFSSLNRSRTLDSMGNSDIKTFSQKLTDAYSKLSKQTQEIIKEGQVGMYELDNNFNISQGRTDSQKYLQKEMGTTLFEKGEDGKHVYRSWDNIQDGIKGTADKLSIDSVKSLITNLNAEVKTINSKEATGTELRADEKAIKESAEAIGKFVERFNSDENKETVANEAMQMLANNGIIEAKATQEKMLMEQTAAQEKGFENQVKKRSAELDASEESEKFREMADQQNEFIRKAWQQALDTSEARQRQKEGNATYEDLAKIEEYNKLRDAVKETGVYKSLEDLSQKADSKIRKDNKAHEEQQAKYTKTALSDLQSLQQMLSQNAPNQFTKSITGDLGKMLSQLDEGKRSFSELAAQLTTEQKLQIQQGILNSVDQSLGTIQGVDQGIMQMEDQMKHASPLHQKLIQGRINQLNLQKAGEQANIDRQLSMTKGTDLHKQIQDRQELSDKMTEQIKRYNEDNGAMDKNMAKMSQFGQSVKGMLATSFQYGVVYRGAQSVIQQIYTIIGSIQEFDALMTQLRMVNGAGEDITANMIAGYKQLGDEMGLTTQEVTATAVTFLRQGRNIADTNELMRQSAILAKTAFMDQNQAAELLTSTLNGFKLEAKDAAKVIDLVAYTDTMTATSADELMTAFQYVASSADTAGIEVEKLNAMIATSSEATRLSAQMIGTAYKTIVSRLQQVKVGSLVDAETGEDISNVDKMLKQYGLTVMDVNGKMKDGDQILSEFAELWNSWGNDTAKKREAVEALAGTRQGNIAMSLFENWDRYEEILSETEANAAGSASKKMDVAKESIQTSLAQLQNALRQFGQYGTDIFKWVVDLGTGLVKWAPPILIAVAALRLMKTQGSDLITLYQMQFNMIDKVKMSMLELTNIEGARNIQAERMLKNSQLQSFTVGNQTAFVDRKTGQVTEQMDNISAANKMAIYADNTYRSVLDKVGIKPPEGGFVRTTETQASLYNAAFNGRLGANADEGAKYVNTLNEKLTLQVKNRNITDEQKAGLLKYANYLGTSEDFVGEEGVAKRNQRQNMLMANISGKTLDDKQKDIIGQMIEAGEAYEPPQTAEQQQIDIVNALNVAIEKNSEKFTELSGILNTVIEQYKKSIGVSEDEEDTVKKNGEKQQEISENQQKNAEEEIKVDKEQTEITEELSETQVDSTGKTVEATDLSVEAEKYDAKASLYSADTEYIEGKANLQKGLTKGQQVGRSASSMGSMMLGSYGVSGLLNKAGMDSQASSMLGMGAGMGLSMLSKSNPILSIVISSITALVNFGLEARKKEHEEVMNNIKEASDAYKNNQSKLKEIDNQEFKNEFERLSQGVDENGQNVSLSDEEYENYQSAVEKLTDGHEELIKGYNKEGQAIVDRDKILEKSIELTKEQMELEKQKMYGKDELKHQGKDFNSEQKEIWNDWKKHNKLDLSNIGAQFIQGNIKSLLGDQSSAQLSEERVSEYLLDDEKFNSVIAEAEKIKANDTTIEKMKEYRQLYLQERHSYEKELQQIDAQRKTQWKGYVETRKGADWDDTQIAFMGDLIDNYKGEEFRDLSKKSKMYDILDNYANMIDDKSVYGALRTFNTDRDSLAISELRTRQEAVLKATSKYKLNDNDKEALGISELDKIEKEFKDKLKTKLGVNIDENGKVTGENADKYNAIVADIANTNLANLKNLNSNFKKLMVDDVITEAQDGVKVLTSAIGQLVAQAEKLENIDFGDKVDIAWQTKNTEGLTNLMDLVKNYRENDKVMSPEILKGLEEIKSTYNLTPVEMDKALANEQGIWELNADNVKKLMSTMLVNALEDNENYSYEDLQTLSQNAEYLGIKGVDQLGFGEILTKFIDKGFLVANAEGITTSDKKFTSFEQEDLYTKAIETDVYKNNISSYQEYARTANRENKDNILSTQSLITRFAKGINLEENKEGFLAAANQALAFENQLEKTISALGGFTNALDKFSAVDLVNNELIMGKFAKGDVAGFASDVKSLTGDDFGGATDNEIAELSLGYLEREKAKYQLQLDQLNSTEFKDSTLAGMIEKEGRDAKRAEEDAKQKWDDLLKEARLSKLKLDIDLVQIGLDKLNKTVSTLSSSMDLLSEKDGVGRFDLLIQQLSTVNELSGDLNAEWNRLEEALATAETGEEQQAIVEQMSAISDSMTESAMKQMQLEKEMNDVLANGFADRISNMKSIVDRELSLLDAQKKKTDSNQFIFYNPNAIGLFGTLKRDKTEYEKRRSETQKIIEDEKKRQEAITKLRKEASQNIYEDEKTRREREIKRAEEDWKEAWDKVGDATAEGMKTAAQNAIDEIESYITAFNEAGYTLNVNGEVTFNGNSVTQAENHMSQAQQRNTWSGKVSDLNAQDWGAINVLRDNALKGDINPLKKARQTRNTMDNYGISSAEADSWLKYELKTNPLLQADTYLKVNGNEIDFGGSNSFTHKQSGATIYNSSWATDTEKTSSDQLVGKYFFDSKNNNRGYIESQNEAGSFRVVYANGIIKEGVKREDLKTKDMYFITYQDMINHVNAQKNDIGTPYGNKLATSIINNTNSRISKIAGEKADEWLFHGNGSIERLEYKQGGTVIPFDTEVAGSRYTDQLDDVLLRDKGTSGGNKIATLFNNKDSFATIFAESLKEISNEVEDKTSEKGSSNTDNLWSIIHEALKGISEEERINKEAILSDTENINQDIKANETKTKDDIHSKIVTMNDSIIKNTEDFSVKFKTIFDDLAENLLSLGDASKLVTEASKYIGQNNSTGKFSNGRIEEWCADFVSYVLDEIGVSLDKVPRSSSVANFYNAFEANNALTNNPSIGNLAIKGKNDHIGIVASVDGDKIVLIEGNTGNKDDKKSVVSQNTYSLSEMLKNGWEFGVYDKGIGSTNNKNLSHYGIMSEKKGEYKVDKKTGEWIYEPYETVVDTNKYDVISSEKSQKIRSRQYDEGTVETESLEKEFYQKLINLLEDSQLDMYKYYSDEFADYLTEYNRKYGEFAYQTAQRAKDNNIDFYDYSYFITRYNEEQSKQINVVKIEQTTNALVDMQTKMGELSKVLADAQANGEDISGIMESLGETYDNYQDTLEQLNEQLSNVAETIKEELLTDLTQGLSHTTSAIVRLKDELNELQHAANMMFDTQYQAKILNGMSAIVRISEQLVATTNKADRLKGANNSFTVAIQEAFETMMPGFWDEKNVGEALQKVFNVDGSINEYAQERFISVLKNLYDINMGAEQIAKIEKTTDQNEKAKLIEELAIANNISTEQMTAFINAQANFNAMVENSQSIYETAQEINALEEQRFTQLNELISLQKEALNTEKEERFSLLKAINNNNQLLSEMVALQSKLIRDVNVTDRASNMREQYNKTLDLAESQEEYVDTLRAELKNLINEFKSFDVTTLDEYGQTYINEINPRDWMDASGEIIAEFFNRDLNMLQTASKNATEDGNFELAAEYEKAIASMELIAQMQGEYTVGMKELGNILADGIAQQEEVIKQQSEWMKQYITELVSGLQYNINNNETLQSYISTTTGSYGQFDRDNKQLSNNAEIEVLQANSDSLLKKLSTLKEETAKIKEDIYDITGVDLGTLFSADGERHAYNYTKFTRELEENLRKGVITNNEYTDILAKLETYEEIVKEEVQAQDDIVKNYQEINSTIEEQIKLAIDSYNWQIKKQETLLSLKEKQFETENKIYRLRLDLDKELRSAKQTTQWLTESERRKIFNEESYTRSYQSLDEMESKTTAYAEEYYDQIMGLTEDTLYQQEYITNEYERRLALVEMEYNITKQKVDLEKKQMELANVLAEKNSRVYVNGEWRQVANMEDVKNASEEVADIEAELKLAEEERLQKIQSNQMQEYIDSLKKNQAALENSMNYTSDTNKELINKLSEFVGSIVGEDLNADSLNQTVRNTVTSISNFNQSLDVLVDDTIKSAIDTLGTLKTSLEEKIKNYTDEVDNLKTQTERQNSRLEQANLDLFNSNSELCVYLDKLSEKIRETIQKIDNTNSTPSDVHEIVNDISNYKKNYETSENSLIDITKQIEKNSADWFNASPEEQERLHSLNQDLRQQALDLYEDMMWNAGQAEEDRKYLRENGYADIADIAEAYGAEQFENYHKMLEKTDKTIKDATAQWKKENAVITNKSQKINSSYIKQLQKEFDYYNEQIEQEKIIAETEKEIVEQDKENTQRQTNNLAQDTINVLKYAYSTEDFAEAVLEYGLDVRGEGIYIKEFGVYVDKQGNILDKFDNVIGKLPQSLNAIFNELIDKIQKLHFIYKEEEEEESNVIYRDGEKYTDKNGNGWYENETGNKFIDTSGKEYAGYRTDPVTGETYFYNPETGYDSRNQKPSSGSTGSTGSTGSNSKPTTNNSPSNTSGSPSSGAGEPTRADGRPVWIFGPDEAATGERFTTEPIYNVDEIGKELIIPPIASGRYAAMEYGSQIVPHNLSENILKWGAINPASINANKPEFTSNLTNNAITYSIGTIKLDNVTNGENFIPELNRFLQRTTTLNNR